MLNLALAFGSLDLCISVYPQCVRKFAQHVVVTSFGHWTNGNTYNFQYNWKQL